MPFGVINCTGKGAPANLKNFGSKNVFSLAHPMQKNSLNSTVPLFSKSDKKLRRYQKCDFDILMQRKFGRRSYIVSL